MRVRRWGAQLGAVLAEKCADAANASVSCTERSIARRGVHNICWGYKGYMYILNCRNRARSNLDGIRWMNNMALPPNQRGSVESAGCVRLNGGRIDSGSYQSGPSYAKTRAPPSTTPTAPATSAHADPCGSSAAALAPLDGEDALQVSVHSDRYLMPNCPHACPCPLMPNTALLD